MLDALHIPTYLITLFNTLYGITVLSIALMLILENRNPIKSISWILVIILFPIVGLVFYIFFGQNLRKKKIISRKSIKEVEYINGYYDKLKQRFDIRSVQLHPDIEDKRNLVSLLYKSNHALFTSNNSISVLNSGKHTFERIIIALESAQEFIHLEFYIFANDEIGRKIADVLKRKAQAGIEVRVIVDDVGSWELKQSFFKGMEDAGVQIFPFLKVRFPFFTSKINYRNHRKILVIDGRIGFMGGYNIADRYINGHEKIGGVWRDTHLEIKGSAINSLQSVFILDWYFVSQQSIKDKRYFPEHETEGDVAMQIISSSPDHDWKTIEQAFFMAISGAKKSVYLTTPYFLPTDSIRMALRTVALSGVDVKLIIPGKSDAYMTQASSRSYLRDMLEAGVQIYFYRKGFMHGKTIMVDGVISSVGSANLDFRSFDYNFEITSIIYNQEVTKALELDFEEDLKNSDQIILREWKKRPFIHKVGQSFARLFSPLL